MTEQAGKINLNETGLSKITRVLFFCPYQRYSLNEKKRLYLSFIDKHNHLVMTFFSNQTLFVFPFPRASR